MIPSLPLLSCESLASMKGNPARTKQKKKQKKAILKKQSIHRQQVEKQTLRTFQSSFLVPQIFDFRFHNSQNLLGCFSATRPFFFLYSKHYWGPSIKYVRKIFRKTNISNPPSLICTRTCASQEVKNVSFSENFAYVPNGWLLKAHGEKFHLPI